MNGFYGARKRKADAAFGDATNNKRPRLIFGETIILRAHGSFPVTANYIVHKSLILQRSSKFNPIDNEIIINAKAGAVQAWLNWAYDQSCEILQMARCVTNYTDFEWDHTTGANITEQNTVYRTLGLFDLWYVGHVLGDKEYCNLVMDTICQQSVANHLMPIIAKWVWKCRCAEGCWEGGSDGFFEGPFKWLLHCLSMPGYSVDLLDIMRNEQMTWFAQTLLEQMSQVQQLGLERDPSLAIVVPRHYHVI